MRRNPATPQIAQLHRAVETALLFGRSLATHARVPINRAGKVDKRGNRRMPREDGTAFVLMAILIVTVWRTLLVVDAWRGPSGLVRKISATISHDKSPSPSPKQQQHHHGHAGTGSRTGIRSNILRIHVDFELCLRCYACV